MRNLMALALHQFMHATWKYQEAWKRRFGVALLQYGYDYDGENVNYLQWHWTRSGAEKSKDIMSKHWKTYRGRQDVADHLLWQRDLYGDPVALVMLVIMSGPVAREWEETVKLLINLDNKARRRNVQFDGPVNSFFASNKENQR